MIEVSNHLLSIVGRYKIWFVPTVAFTHHLRRSPRKVQAQFSGRSLHSLDVWRENIPVPWILWVRTLNENRPTLPPDFETNHRSLQPLEFYGIFRSNWALSFRVNERKRYLKQPWVEWTCHSCDETFFEKSDPEPSSYRTVGALTM